MKKAEEVKAFESDRLSDAEEVKSSGSGRVSESDALFEQARGASNRGESRAALQLYSKCSKLFEQEGRLDGVIRVMALSSSCNTMLANRDEALKLAKKADALAVRHFGERSKHRLEPLYCLSECLRLLKDLNPAREKALLLGEVARSVGSDFFVGRSFQELARICRAHGDFETALKHCEQARPLATIESERLAVLSFIGLEVGLLIPFPLSFANTLFPTRTFKKLWTFA